MNKESKVHNSFGHYIASQYGMDLIQSVQVITKIVEFLICTFFSIFLWKGTLDSGRVLDMHLWLLVLNWQNWPSKFCSMKDSKFDTQFARTNIQVLINIILWDLSVFSSGAHISLMMPKECNLVPLTILKQVERKWRNKPVKFIITGCEVYYHEDGLGNKEWLVCFAVRSSDLLQLRKDLLMKNDDSYNSHVTILECKAK